MPRKKKEGLPKEPEVLRKQRLLFSSRLAGAVKPSKKLYTRKRSDPIEDQEDHKKK